MFTGNYAKSRISIAKAACNKEKTLFAIKLDLNVRKNLVKCYHRSVAFYGDENYTFRKTDHTYIYS